MHANERELRRDLAAALRQAAHLGFHEGICNHFSVVVPDGEGRNARQFLINPEGVHWLEMTPDALALCELDREDVGVPEGVEATAFHIHREIHRLVPHATCALHTHMPYATALCLRKDMRLKMASQNALRFYGRVGYETAYGGLALDSDEGRHIGGALSNADVAFLANHGVVAVGPTVAEAFDNLYYLERACQHQILAETGGHELNELAEATCRAVAAQFAETRPAGAKQHFEAIKRLLGAPFAA
jgi:ribulose-5-phosphate 4-epimerase/fuculose-1-phosphate aldolase